MTDDRRSEERVEINLAARWDGMAGSHEARLEDISLGGCFVNTQGRVEKDEVVSLEVRLPSGEWLALRGEVTSHQPGIGFGLLFSFPTEDEEDALKDLLAGLQ
jgi:hypothetical protein